MRSVLFHTAAVVKLHGNAVSSVFCRERLPCCHWQIAIDEPVARVSIAIMTIGGRARAGPVKVVLWAVRCWRIKISVAFRDDE
jgi:hypothetical protein